MVKIVLFPNKFYSGNSVEFGSKSLGLGRKVKTHRLTLAVNFLILDYLPKKLKVAAYNLGDVCLGAKGYADGNDCDAGPITRLYF